MRKLLAILLNDCKVKKDNCYNTEQIFFLNSVLRNFQDYFISYETGQSVGGRKQKNPEKNRMAHPQAVRGSNPHQAQR